ncbi:MAG: alcohol dehydrogenase catalytic domain-containing protein [Treponema sp.]|jgi:L-gulonate 5-dehydrogenase|nr:alcohol dehydrogenase catalytic domain-containing protein [Treponema sp.]
MKQVTVTSPLHFEIAEVPVPELRNDYEVLIRMKSAGVCGSDVHLYHGKNPNSTYPRIPGHENAGIIEKTGSKVSRVKAGDHVIVDLISACGECYQCKIGRKNVCESVKVRGSGADGGWREFFTAPESEVYKISHDVLWEDAAMVEPFAIGAHCTGRGRIVPGDRVLILGTGTIGSIILQTCKAKGCETVICCDISNELLERAKSYGADYIVNTKNEDLAQAIKKITGAQGVTIAFDSACFPGSLTSILRPGIVCNAGRVVPLGFCTDTEGITQAMINQRELDIIGTRMSCYQFEPTIKNMEAGKFNMKGLATTFMSIGEMDKVFHFMEHPEPSVKKMVILF